ncbi:MAG: hypothetical protein ACRDRO_18780 [Pseudonocardiaceae bacterium]
MCVRHPGVRHPGVRNLGVRNLGVRNLGVRNLGVRNLGVRNIVSSTRSSSGHPLACLVQARRHASVDHLVAHPDHQPAKQLGVEVDLQ